MAMFHDNPNRAVPNSWMWYSVSTPSIFREFKLPVADEHMTSTHRKQYRELQALAAAHGTHIHESGYRRG